MNLFQDMISIDYKKGMGITGITDEFFCAYLYNLLIENKKNILVVTNSLYEANHLFSSLESYTDSVFLFPMDDFLTSEAIAMSPELEITRLETLNQAISLTPKIIITNLMGYLRFLPKKSVFENAICNFNIGDEISPKKLVAKLINSGYKRESIVTKTGEVGVRGFVIDVFPLGYDDPVRIEFFGDVIESIRSFSITTQKSKEQLKSVIIRPFTEFVVDSDQLDLDLVKQKYLPNYGDVVNISEYMEDVIVAFKDYSQLQVSNDMILKECFNYKTENDTDFNGNYMFSLNDIKEKEYFYYLDINNLSSFIDKNDIISVNLSTISVFNENIDSINNFINAQLSNNKTVVICVPKNKFRNIRKFLNMKIAETDVKNISKGFVNLVDVNLQTGFIYDDFVILTSHELFIDSSSNKKYKTKFKYGSKIKNVDNLEIGDYVVHNSHGIGIYNGIKVLTMNNISKDYLEVLYSGKDKLYIPVEKIDLLTKYVGKDGSVPKINKMDGIDWKKTKNRVKQKVADMADKLLKLYAERELQKGFAFSLDNKLMEQFEDDCGFTLTPDQQIAVNQIKLDMEKATPMDRLLCGDVGFGKTEVAFRAAFKAILDSKQVLFLCPTTILSSQHYDNALKRFKNFPVNIALLNRFTSKKEVNNIISGLKDGTIDLVFGTHRLLSNDIVPKDLGLLVVDEEQRFGVTHKEKIKEYKTNVDVLTLTATPIPRTLQMSMVGMRSLSLIETPPVDRYPIQTYVVEENKQIIRDAIYKELSRNGQIYILFNKVENIERKVNEIKNLVPDASVSFAHGQMSKIELENKMTGFIKHEFDVLVCTTIIETGIDIPNVNTLIVLDADHFGLSQLYQIRGRVGRSNKFAYAYLMYNKSKVLTETAVKRLNVIKEFTELGSGFSIATRDLSIRGAGDILGSEQAGFIDTVGIDLYLKMLNVEVERRKGKDVSLDDLDDDNSVPLINVSTHIDDSYVSDEGLKIEIHKKINEVDSKHSLDQIKGELEDRFGKLDQSLVIYMYEEWFEKQALKIGLKSVVQTKNYIELCFPKEVVEKFDTEDLFMESFKITPMFRFKSRGSNLLIILDTIKLEKHPLYYLTELLDYILDNFIKSID
jgi:transcription-repair coupling factor